MSREYCASCNPCKGINKNYCDNCSANCCQENMKKHREAFYLYDQFQSKVNYAENDLKSTAEQAKNNLYKNYSINLYQCTCCLSHCENFLNEMKDKYREMVNYENFLNNQIQHNKKSFENEKINLSNNLEYKFREINNLYEQKKRGIRNREGKRNDDIIENITQKRNEKRNLEKEIKNIQKTNVNQIVDDLIKEEKTKMEYDYENQKNLIDKKNQIIVQNLEYTEEEKNLQGYYLNTINNIKNYSDKIPFFDNWIKAYNLNKYIN